MVAPSNVCAICGTSYSAEALFCPRDGAPLGARAPSGHDDFIGIELPGQIAIERLIGIGSMGRVYRGFQRAMKRPVAVKILHRDLSANRTLVARFHREAQIASRIAHPHVVQALLAGQLPEGGAGSGALYIVMEFLDGISLRSAFAAAEGAIPLPRALRIVLQLCEAVGEAHAKGVVHRDLKPENLMLLNRGHDNDFVKVLDFGIARLPGSDTASVTHAGAVFGTARYVSPEGAIGSPVGPAADVYAIATILYQALAGRTPFDGETAVEVLGHQIHDAPPALRSIERAAYVPEPIAAAIMRNLAKRPEDRCQDAQALGLLLVDAARASGLSPEKLVPRPAFFEGPGDQAPFSAIERTKQQPFGAGLPPSEPIVRSAHREQQGDEAEHRARAGSRVTDRPAKRGSTGPLAFLVGCVAGGVALAAIGTYRSQSSADEAPPSKASASLPGVDAAIDADGGNR